MNRTAVLLAVAGLLAAAAVVVGKPKPPPVKDTSHTVVQPGEETGGVTLPLLTAPGDGALTLEGKLSGAYVQAGPSEAFAHFQVKARPAKSQARVPVTSRWWWTAPAACAGRSSSTPSAPLASWCCG